MNAKIISGNIAAPQPHRNGNGSQLKFDYVVSPPDAIEPLETKETLRDHYKISERQGSALSVPIPNAEAPRLSTLAHRPDIRGKCRTCRNSLMSSLGPLSGSVAKSSRLSDFMIVASFRLFSVDLLAMPYVIVQREEDDAHVWCLATAACRLDDANDSVIATTVSLVRRSYGEDEILANAATVMAPEIAEATFRTEHLLAAVRAGLPDPAAEGDKPPHLTTYRSQSAEMVAKAALAAAYQFEYPAAPQQGVTNPNQPVLGFDGWGLLRQPDGSYTLILIQVKATDERACPPGEATKLALECRRIPRDRSALSRALCVLSLHLNDGPLKAAVLQMLALMGNNGLPAMHVAPAIIRGRYQGQIGDLEPIRQSSAEFAPATAREIVVTIGVSLADFGEIVMRKAREIT